MKLIYVTVSMPYGPGETFFVAEVKEILRQGHQILIVQRSPAGDVTNHDADGLENFSLRRPLLSPGVVVAAILEFLTHPLAAACALGVLFESRTPLILLKNLLVFPKGLWLGRLARQWKAEHIHAQWGLTTATMALVASRVSGVPWSCTVHRGDIVDNNLLERKAIESQFLRVISEDGIALATDICGRPLKGNVIMLHLGVELPAAPPVQYALHAPPTLLCPAALTERKGQQYLIEALAILRGAEPMYAFDSPARATRELPYSRLLPNTASMIPWSFSAGWDTPNCFNSTRRVRSTSWFCRRYTRESPFV